MKNKKNKQISLENKLEHIYNSVDLKTTCCGNTTCCKTGCPQMHFSEFSSLINKVWNNSSKAEKIELICKSIEYFFRNQFEKWNMDALVKPCLLLSPEGKCKYYDHRPLNCRLYGLWPKDVYNERVDKFEKAYRGLLKRKELPLNTQCPNVKRLNDSIPLTKEIIDNLFAQLNVLDAFSFSKAQIDNGENYRTFHDWLLLKIFGEDWLVRLTNFILAANKDIMVEQLEEIKKAVRVNFSRKMPKITER